MGEERKYTKEELEQKLAPASIWRNLTRASLVLTAWELLLYDVVEKTKGFFLTGMANGEFVYSDGYEKDVLSLHKKPLQASLMWLVKSSALTQDQADAVLRLRDVRNEVAHEIPKFLVDPGHAVDLGAVREMGEVVRRLGVFFGGIEVDTDADWDGKEVDYEGIKSGSFVLIEHVLAMANALEKALDQLATSELGASPQG